jgi:hypothetical protein
MPDEDELENFGGFKKHDKVRLSSQELYFDVIRLRSQCAWRAIAEVKQHSQKSVIGWAIKSFSSSSVLRKAR